MPTAFGATDSCACCLMTRVEAAEAAMLPTDPTSAAVARPSDAAMATQRLIMADPPLGPGKQLRVLRRGVRGRAVTKRSRRTQRWLVSHQVLKPEVTVCQRVGHECNGFANG